MCRAFRYLFDIEKLAQLRLSEYEYRAGYTDDEVDAEEACVVEEGVKILTHSVGSPLSPYHDTGQEVAKEAEHDYRDYTNIDVELHVFCELELVEYTC